MTPIIDADLQQTSTPDLLAGIRHEELIQRQSAARQGALLAELERRGIRDSTGYPTAVAYLQNALHITLAEARSRVARAFALNPCGITTTTTVPSATASAASEGAIGAGQIDEILDSLAKLPTTLSDHERELEEKKLADLARTGGPGSIRKTTKEILAHYALNGHLPVAPSAKPAPDKPAKTPVEETVRIRRRRGGGHHVSATITDETCAKLQILLDKHDKPRRDANGNDNRTLSRRRGDALTRFLARACAQTSKPRKDNSKKPHPVTPMYLRQGKRSGPRHLPRAKRRRSHRETQATQGGR